MRQILRGTACRLELPARCALPLQVVIQRRSPGVARRACGVVPLGTAIAFLLTLLPAVSSRSEGAHRRVASGQERTAEPGAGSEVGADLLLYQVQIARTGDAALDDALSAVARLVQLREEAPTTAFGLVARAADDRERLARALHSEGYWDGSIQILLGSLALSIPALVERPEGGQERPVVVRISAEPGPRYTLSSIVVSASMQDGMAPVATVTEENIGLSPGDPAAAAPVLCPWSSPCSWSCFITKAPSP